MLATIRNLRLLMLKTMYIKGLITKHSITKDMPKHINQYTTDVVNTGSTVSNIKKTY